MCVFLCCACGVEEGSISLDETEGNSVKCECSHEECKGEEEYSVNERTYRGFYEESTWEVVLENDFLANTEFVIEDEQLALRIGDAIIRSYYGEDAVMNTYIYAKRVASEGCFVVCRYSKELIPGGGLNVAFRYNGEIIRLWIDE